MQCLKLRRKVIINCFHLNQLKYLKLILLLIGAKILFLSGYSSQAQVHIEAAKIPQPGQFLIEQWTEQYFDIQEFWIIKSINGLREFLIKNHFSDVQMQSILNRVQKKLTSEQMGRLISNLSLGDSQGVIFVDEELKKSFNQSELQHIYHYLWQNNKLIHYQAFANKTELYQFLNKYSNPQSEFKSIEKMLFYWEDKIFLIYTPEFWPRLNKSLRQDYVIKSLKDSPNRFGHQILIYLNKEQNLTKLAEKYAMGRNPAPIERYLYQLKNLGIQQIPIEQILTPFIRRFVNQYSVCHGPNCMNSAMNAGKIRKMISIQTTDTDEFLSNMHEAYEMVFIEHEHELRPGDVLVYSDFNKGMDIDHAAVYIGHGIVFTKNGVSRNHPYIFQLKSKMEENLKYIGQQSLIVYRPMRPHWRPSCRYVFQ